MGYESLVTHSIFECYYSKNYLLLYYMYMLLSSWDKCTTEVYVGKEHNIKLIGYFKILELWCLGLGE